MSVTQSAVLLSAVRPFPMDNGKSVVIAGFLRHLSGRCGASNVHFVHVGAPLGDMSDLSEVSVHEMGVPTMRDRLVGGVVKAGLQRRSLQESLTWSPSVAAHVRRAIVEIDPDIVVIDTIRMAQHLDGLPLRGRRILYLDDLFSVRYRRMLEVIDDVDAEETGFDPIGNFAGNIPAPLRPLTAAPTTRRMLLRTEARRVARSEVRAAELAEVCLLLNEHEVTHLREVSTANVTRVSPLVQVSAHTPARWNGAADFAFVGLLSIPHNHDGLTWFLRNGMPELLTRRPDARLHVFGRGISPDLAAEADRFGDRIIVHGFVEDLDAALGPMCALVSPLRFGSGIKIKTLDALARGLPTVTTPVGAEGIREQDGPGLRVCSGAAEIGLALARLADPNERAIEAAAARRLYREQYAQAVVQARYDEVFGTRETVAPTQETTRPERVSA